MGDFEDLQATATRLATESIGVLAEREEFRRENAALRAENERLRAWERHATHFLSEYATWLIEHGELEGAYIVNAIAGGGLADSTEGGE